MAHHQEAVIITSNQTPGVTNLVVASPIVRDVWTDNGRYNIVGAKNLGVWQLLCGIASVISGITIAATPYIVGPTYYTPAWAGGFYITAGIFGLVSQSKQSCAINGFMAFSILSSLFASMQTFYQARIVFWWFFWGLPSYWIIYFCMAAAAAGFTEFIVAIMSAAQCCKGATCCKCCWSCCACCCGPPAVEVDMAVEYRSPDPPVSRANPAFDNTPNQAPVNHNSPSQAPFSNSNMANPNQSNLGYPSSAYPHSAYSNPANPNSAYPKSDYPNRAYPNSGYPNQAYPNRAYPNQAYPNSAYPNQSNVYHNRPNYYQDANQK